MSFLTNYIFDDDFEIHYTKGKLNIVNYIKINYMEREKISVSNKEGSVVVNGKNLRIQKLLDNEILISGTFDTVEWKRANE